MRICIFSDIHGNFQAFEKMLEAERDTTHFLFAGDIFGYFYEQAEIIDRMTCQKNLFAVKGNHDVNYLQDGRNNRELADRYGSSYNTILSGSQRNYLENLPEYLELELGGKRFGIFHGGYEDHLNQRIYPDSNMETAPIAGKYDYLILGHTHYRFIRKEKDLVIINPGSLGQPRDGKGFSYCVLNTENSFCEFKTVSINMKSLLDQVSQKDADRKVCDYLYKKYGERK